MKMLNWLRDLAGSSGSLHNRRVEAPWKIPPR